MGVGLQRDLECIGLCQAPGVLEEEECYPSGSTHFPSKLHPFGTTFKFSLHEDFQVQTGENIADNSTKMVVTLST